jgi:predicted nucleotidyltransferase
MPPKISFDRQKLADFCQRWGITELALFGSALREDFRADSDVDVLATFAPDRDISFDKHMQMLDELAAIFGREVDMVEKANIRNPFRRHHILTTKEVVYAA